MANAWCINAYDCNGCLIQTLQNLDSACIGVGVQYTAPNPLDDKRLDYIKYTDKCWCVQCLSAENEILIYATNGVIKNLTLTNDDVNEAIKIKWNDIFWSNRAKTIIRYKTWSYPTSITDWTLAVEETTKNAYSSDAFQVSGLEDWTTYYFTAFAVDLDGTIIDVQSMSIKTEFDWIPTNNTVAYYKLKSSTTINDETWNYNLTNMWAVSFWEYQWVDCAIFPWTSTNSQLKNTAMTFSARPQQSVALWFYITWTYQDYFQCIYEIWHKNWNNLLWSWYKHSWSPNWLSLSWFTWASEVVKSWNLINWWHCLMNITNWSSSVQYLDNVLYQSMTNQLTWEQNWIWIWLPTDCTWLTDPKTRCLIWALSRVVVENIAWNETKRNEYYNKTRKFFWK